MIWHDYKQDPPRREGSYLVVEPRYIFHYGVYESTGEFAFSVMKARKKNKKIKFDEDDDILAWCELPTYNGTPQIAAPVKHIKNTKF